MNKHWLRKWLRGEPHVIIGGEDNPYLLRWFVIPRNRFFNVYLHKFKRSDDDRALHDHPWWFASLILAGEYIEHRLQGVPGHTERRYTVHRKAGSLAFRRPNTLHRVELLQETTDFGHFVRYREAPVWTLFFTGPKIREWGFQCPGGWVHWIKFVDQNGCGEFDA